MGDYIERQSVMDAYDEVQRKNGPWRFESLIESVPASDVRPVVRGRWLVVEHEYLHCSVCGEAMYTGCDSTKQAMLLKDHWKNFCPNCGADMRGGDEQ